MKLPNPPNLAEQIADTRRAIAARQQQRRSTAVLHHRLVLLVARQLRRESKGKAA